MNLKEEDLVFMLSEYEVGDIIDYSKLSNGTVQLNYKITTTQGIYILKYYTNRTYNQVLFEYKLIQFLLKRDFPTAPIITTKNSTLKEYKKHPYMIFNYIEGRHIEKPDKQHIKQIIEEMASLHKQTVGFYFEHMSERLTYELAEMTPLVKEKSSAINTSNAKRKLAWWLREAEQLTLPKGLSKAICHCDYNPMNIIYSGSILRALIDFDDANYTYRCMDIVSFTNFFDPAFDHNTWNRYKAEEVMSFDEARSVFKLYNALFPLNNLDRRHVFDLLKFVTLIDCIWYFERGDYRNFYERKKIEALNKLGREKFYALLFL